MLYVISDVHGNYEGLIKALQKKKIIDKKGRRQLARKHKVISVGDLSNCVEDSIIGDNECYNLMGNVIDYVCLANHEAAYFDERLGFNGFHYYEGLHRKLLELEENGMLVPAYLHNGTLISHAGISKSILSVSMDVNEIYGALLYHWKAFNYNYSWFSSIGQSRGGKNHCGGILWCDWKHEFRPTDFPQIVGHTPNGGVRMNGNSICIDVGAKCPGTKPFILEVR